MGAMKRDEFEYRLKELVTKVDSVVAADAMMEMARRCYLQHADERARDARETERRVHSEQP